MRLLIVPLLVVLSGIGNSAVAQQASASIVSPDRANAQAYRTLFRRALNYNKLADEADLAHTPKPHLRHVLATRYALSDEDSASLQRIAIAYQTAIKPIHDRTVEVVKQYRARFPFGVIQAGMDATPPPDLSDLQQKDDAVTLLYRDLLRNSMREENFQKLNLRVTTDFGGHL
jgi:hypothetical protein